MKEKIAREKARNQAIKQLCARKEYDRFGLTLKEVKPIIVDMRDYVKKCSPLKWDKGIDPFLKLAVEGSEEMQHKEFYYCLSDFVEILRKYEKDFDAYCNKCITYLESLHNK